MNKLLILSIVIFMCISSSLKADSLQEEFQTCLFDSIRQRPIPIAIYQPKKINKHTRVVIFNHGYGKNDSSSYLIYSYLTRALADNGYYVISIQHELPNDPLLAMEGEFMQTRMPNWKRGVENIHFIINEFQKLQPILDWKSLALIGHSNGGDMTMLFAAEYPQLIGKAISLDHRRMIMPRIGKPRIYTLRGCDYEADNGVIPTVEEQQKWHTTVIKLDGIKHSDMDNKGTQDQHKAILTNLLKFLNEQ